MHKFLYYTKLFEVIAYLGQLIELRAEIMARFFIVYLIHQVHKNWCLFLVEQ